MGIVEKCRLHPELEKLIAKYRNGVPMDGGFCRVCENKRTLDIIAERAKDGRGIEMETKQVVGKEAVEDQFKQWVSLDAIAEVVFDALRETDPELATLDNAQIVWFDVLEHLYELVDNAIQCQDMV